jgi:hypothetical protein
LAPGIGNVAGEFAGIGTVDPSQALEESGFFIVVGSGRVPVREKMFLSVCQQFADERLFIFVFS